MIKGTVVVDKKCQKYTSHPLTATAVVRDSRGPGQPWSGKRRQSSPPAS